GENYRDHGAARSRRPHCGFAGLARLWVALGHGAALCPGGEAVHASTRGFCAFTQSTFRSVAPNHCAAAAFAESGERRICGFSETRVRAKTQDAGQQSAATLSRPKYGESARES